MVTVQEKYGFLPISINKFKNVPDKWKEIDSKLNVDLIRRASDCKYLPSLPYSKFSYDLCEFVYKYWSNPGDIILDPFMGWGIRGAVATTLGRKYIGYEISKTMFNKTSDFLKEFYTELHLSDGCKIEEIQKESINLIFTCPPYWDIEKYESIENQLSDYKTYEEFLNKLEEGFKRYYEVLITNSFCIFVVADFRKNGFRNFHGDTINLALKSGFILWDIMVNELSSPFVWTQIAKCDNQKYTSKSHEYVLVFKKADKNLPEKEFIVNCKPEVTLEEW